MYQRTATEPEKQPILAFVVGDHGSVDPKVLPELAEQMGALYIDAGVLRGQVYDRLAVPYGNEMHQGIRDRIADIGHLALQEGLDVICSQQFNTPRSRRFILELATDSGALGVGMHMKIRQSLAVARVRAWAEKNRIPGGRNEIWGEHGYVHHALHRKTPVEAMLPLEDGLAVAVDSSKPVPNVVTQILDAFDDRAIHPAAIV